MKDLVLEEAIEEQIKAERTAVTEVSKNKYCQLRFWLEELKECRKCDDIKKART